MRRFLTILASMIFMVTILGLAPAHAKVTGKDVEYTAGGVTLKGYLAYDTAKKGKGPGVLVVHEWWGLNDYARERARMLAKLGYTALAVDMYGEGKTATHPDDAGKFSSELMQNFDTAKARFIAAMDFLKKQPAVDPGRIAAIGYCFGGSVVLNSQRFETKRRLPHRFWEEKIQTNSTKVVDDDVGLEAADVVVEVHAPFVGPR